MLPSLLSIECTVNSMSCIWNMAFSLCGTTFLPTIPLSLSECLKQMFCSKLRESLCFFRVPFYSRLLGNWILTVCPLLLINVKEHIDTLLGQQFAEQDIRFSCEHTLALRLSGISRRHFIRDAVVVTARNVERP